MLRRPATSRLSLGAALVVAPIAWFGCARAGAARDVAPAPPATPPLWGAWEGTLRSPGSPPSRLTIALAEGSGRWRGTLRLGGLGRDPVPFDSVVRSGDAVALYLPAAARHAVLRGRLTADGRRVDGALASDTTVTFSLARAGTAEATALVAGAERAEASRRVAAALVDSVPVSPGPDPDAAKLVSADIPRFWRALDAATPESLAAVLEREYLEPGSLGLRDFIPGRIMSAEDLAAMVRYRRAAYDSVRAANLDVTRADAAIRAAFRRLEALYPDAVFPDVYFVIGRFNSGGTSTRHGLVIGAEMYRDPARLPAIVSHELIHFQQRNDDGTLLAHAFMEGAADFVGEKISGPHIDNAAHAYGRAHERELWQEFKGHIDDRSYGTWMYAKPPGDRPNDLGYFIGYRIAVAYYERATDKRQAIRDIITANGGDVKGLLAKSGYEP